MNGFLRIMCIAVCGLMFSTSAYAQKTVMRLGWTTTDAEKDPFAIGARAFKAALEAHPGGEGIEVQLYPNRQLGDEKALLEGVRMGMAEGGMITNAVVAQMEPAFQLNDLPFIYESSAKAFEVMDGPVGDKLKEKLDRKGLATLGFMGSGFRHMINNVRPINVPADVGGVKFRVMQSPIYISMFESLGGSPVPMAWGETFTAVQQGALDGIEVPLAVANASKTYEIAKYLSLTNHTFTVFEFLVNKRWLNKLTEAQREAVVEAAEQAMQEGRKTVDENAEQFVMLLKEKGMVVNEVENLAAFREKTTPVYEQFRDVIGSDLLDLALEQTK